MKKFLLFVAVLLLGVNLGYSKPTILARGVVVSKVNDELVVGAIIKVNGQEVMTSTDVDGQFTISAEEGSTLEVSCVGYKSTKVKVKPNMVVDLVPNDYRAMHWFVAAAAGPLITYARDDYYNPNYYDGGYLTDHQAEFGIMFGMMGRNWGWYVKPSMPVAFKNWVYKTQYTWSLSFGAMRRIVDNFNIYAGSGIGCGFWPNWDWRDPYYYPNNYYDNFSKYENNFGSMFAVMFELGFQYNIKHVNIELGLEYGMGTNDPQKERNFKPYIGVGYNF